MVTGGALCNLPAPTAPSRTPWLLSPRRGAVAASPRCGYVMNDRRDTSRPGFPLRLGSLAVR